LVDAPCTGLGTLRRNPDLKWRQTPDELARLQPQQASILQQASRLVRPGGRLVYATCSFLPEENEDQVRAFLDKNTDFFLVPASECLADTLSNSVGADGMMRLRPDLHQTDGFFAAVLQRKAPPAKVLLEEEPQAE
jgi:16S rRNA (cytosine967-C5)-methyltransferase